MWKMELSSIWNNSWNEEFAANAKIIQGGRK